jgi:hypothetical protein
MHGHAAALVVQGAAWHVILGEEIEVATSWLRWHGVPGREAWRRGGLAAAARRERAGECQQRKNRGKKRCLWIRLG